MAITMMAMIICRTIISQTSNSCNLDSRWAIWRETKKKKNHLNTISTIMGTLVQPQLCKFSYRKALFWPQKQTWHLSNLLLQWDSQNCQCYPRKTRKSRQFWPKIKNGECFTHTFWTNCQLLCNYLLKYKLIQVVLWKPKPIFDKFHR